MPTVSALVWKNMLMHPVNGLFAWISNTLGLPVVDWLTVMPLGSIIIIVSWAWLPFATLIILTALQSLDQEQKEAAEMDGARRGVDLLQPDAAAPLSALTVVVLIETIFLLSIFAEILVTTCRRSGHGEHQHRVPGLHPGAAAVRCRRRFGGRDRRRDPRQHRRHLPHPPHRQEPGQLSHAVHRNQENAGRHSSPILETLRHGRPVPKSTAGGRSLPPGRAEPWHAQSRSQRKWTFTAIGWAIGLTIFFPILWTFLTSFKTEIEAVASPPSFLFFDWTTENYGVVQTRSDYGKHVMNSIIISFGSCLLGLLIAVPAAWAMAFSPTKRTKDILMWMLSTKMLPPVGVLVPLYLIFRDTGLLDSRTGLVLVLMLINLPIIVWMLYTYFKEIPVDILEAARMDGAPLMKEIIHVLTPMALPGIASTFL